MFFTYLVLLINSWIFVYFPCCFLKITIIISHKHYLHVRFVSITVFQTFNRIIFGRLSFPGARWYVVTVWVPPGAQPALHFGDGNFHELSFGDVVLIQPWYNFFANGHRQSSLRNIPKNDTLVVLTRPVNR